MKNRSSSNKKENKISQQVLTQANVVKTEPEKVDFDSWFVMREDQIPKHHRKEILKADFNARGLKNQETVETFDKALNKYGIKLK